MKKIIVLLFFYTVTLLNFNTSFGQNDLLLVPNPVKTQKLKGEFIISGKTRIVIPSGKEKMKSIAELFSEQLKSISGIRSEIINKEKNKDVISLTLNTTKETELGNEGYRLKVLNHKIYISANEPAGLFYGTQTLLQLIPPVKEKTINIPCTSITDYPRFEWRGLMLDVSRHFFNKEEVMQFLDQMAKYKYNTFHWHLTDDCGWRIEIKAYPRLTSIGAWRVPRTGRYGSFDPAKKGEKSTYGGFYTQNDIKEIVKYAQERFITIVPEIDIPAHNAALIAAYPEFSCIGEPTKVQAGTHGSIGDNVLCVGNEKVYDMLNTIFGELVSLFPGEYIHIGGDEANRSYWKNCPKCQKLIKDKKMENEAVLQSYFTRRVSKILSSKGKRLIGWDEILEGGLAPNATVMSWRGTLGGIAAAKAGHNVVMCPTQYCYFDYMQGEPVIERYGAAHLVASQVYRWDPVPEGIDPKYILGGQGNVWTEMIPNFRRVEYMTWPRALALSEILWSPQKDRKWENFVPRMEAQFPRFRESEVNYSPSIYDPSISMIKEKDGKEKISLGTEIKGLDIFYTFDCSFPDKFSAKYTGKPVCIPKGATDIWAITYRNNKPIGRLLAITLNELEKR